jgi:hypothetical protein
MNDFRGHETPLAWLQDLKLRLRKSGLKYKQPELVAMSSSGDPYLSGTPADLAWARWFADIWGRYGFKRGTYLRRIHYQLVSQGNVPLPEHYAAETGQKFYLNTALHDSRLGIASKHARYLGLIDPRDLVDNGSPKSIKDFTEYVDEDEPWLHPILPDFDLPNLASLPDDWGTPPPPEVYGYEYDTGAQPYLVELWVEKSTVNDELLPICQRYGINLQPSKGFQSITGVVQVLSLAAAAWEQGRPTRIFYISDFDPAGHNMPRQITRQIEFWRDRFAPGADIKLTPLVLTPQQARDYELPRTPIEKDEGYSAAFQERFGEGATELDALTALRPGVLERIVTDAVRQYRDTDLASKYEETAQEAIELVEEKWEESTAEQRERIDTLRDAANAVFERYREALQSDLAPIVDELKNVTAELQKAGREFSDTIELPEPPDPEVQAPDEGGWCFDAARSYMEQLQHYKDRDNGKS